MNYLGDEMPFKCLITENLRRLHVVCDSSGNTEGYGENWEVVLGIKGWYFVMKSTSEQSVGWVC